MPISGHDGRGRGQYDHFAFLPNPLPLKLDLGHEAWMAITHASQALARVDQAGRQLTNPGLLRAPLLRREAVSTSALEGTYAAFTDVLEAESDDERDATPEVREVLNYVRAAEHAFGWLRDGRAISLGLLEDCQAILIRGTPSDGTQSGKVRKEQVIIGPREGGVLEARYIPPPPDDRLRAGLERWLDWLRSPVPLPALAKVALAHYQFEALHPFHDGNGRIGRLVVVLHLLQLGELSEALLEVSPWFEAHRREYQDELLEVSRSGDFDPWIRFFCTGIAAQAEGVVETINSLLDLQTSFRRRVHAEKMRGIAVRIAEDLIGRPYVRATQASKIYDVTYPAANSAIRRLVDAGILTQLGPLRYDRIFVAREVIQVLSPQAGSRS